MINFFLYCIKKTNCSGSPKGTPHDWCRRILKKKYFAMKTNGIRWSSSKNDYEYVHWGPIFYVCSSARNWVSSMYKGIYHIRNSLWGVATEDASSSSTRTFQQKKQVPRNDQFLFILYLTNEFFKLTERYAPRPVSYTHSFNARRVFACILFCSYPCFSFSFDAFAFVGTIISLNLAIVIQNLPKTEKNVQSAGFHTCFGYGNIVIPMVFALALFMYSKILPQIFLPQIF